MNHRVVRLQVHGLQHFIYLDVLIPGRTTESSSSHAKAIGGAFGSPLTIPAMMKDADALEDSRCTLVRPIELE